jgi:methylated-DNA-[protein]-cysteine S-methyltransferase
MNSIRQVLHDSPIGPLRLAASEEGLCALYMSKHRHAPDEESTAWEPLTADDRRQARIIDETQRQLDDYFAGRLTVFDLPLAFHGTEFQNTVWRALCAIGHGVTISYGELARRIGNPKAVRAVGLANGRNPISIVVPCHRVIGADGSMTGYGGGIERKIFLLDLEAKVAGLSKPQQLALV